MNGLGGEARTPDPLLPKQMRYQTALHRDEGLMTTGLHRCGLVQQPGPQSTLQRAVGGVAGLVDVP